VINAAYARFLLEIPDVKVDNNTNESVGINLILTNFFVASNGKICKDFSKTTKIKKLEKQLKG
jgi:hypothetical protein